MSEERKPCPWHGRYTDDCTHCRIASTPKPTTPTPARAEAAPTHAEIIGALGPMVDGGSTSIEQVEQATREHDAARSEAAGGEVVEGVDGKTWLSMLREIAQLADATGDPDEWSEADDGTLIEEFDPWDVLRKARQQLADVEEQRDDARGALSMCEKGAEHIVTMLREARQQLAAAREDGERLDWMQEHYAEIGWLVPNSDPAVCEVWETHEGVRVIASWAASGDGPDLRSAIDAARSEPSGEVDGGQHG